jgi:hypothetical protein
VDKWLVWLPMLRVVAGGAIPVLAVPIPMRAEVSTPPPGMASLLTVSLASATGAGHPLLGHTQACSALAFL